MRFAAVVFLALLLLPTVAYAGPAEEAFKRHDYQAALKLLQPLANQRNQYAKADLGILYYKGMGAKQDYSEALKWFQKAADQEDTEAQYMIGIMYSDGSGVKQDYAETMKWFRKADAKGHETSEYELGR